MHGKVYAVGGCDAWNCLNTVEVYNPELNTWDFLPPLNTARRGCGVAFYQSEYLFGFKIIALIAINNTFEPRCEYDTIITLC